MATSHHNHIQDQNSDYNGTKRVLKMNVSKKGGRRRALDDISNFKKDNHQNCHLSSNIATSSYLGKGKNVPSRSPELHNHKECIKALKKQMDMDVDSFLEFLGFGAGIYSTSTIIPPPLPSPRKELELMSESSDDELKSNSPKCFSPQCESPEQPLFERPDVSLKLADLDVLKN